MLVKSPMSLNEDDEKFQNFFYQRYASLAVKLRGNTPNILRETMKWLNDEVFVQPDNKKEEWIDGEQCAFEELFDKALLEAKEADRCQREIARGLLL